MKRALWIVPVCWKGKEIDAVHVQATSASAAKKAARPFFVDRGYTAAGNYSLGKPYTE